LILALDRRIADSVIALRAGEWNKKEFSKARGLFGRTLGLVGVGKIGQEMIPRARLRHAVVAWSRSLTARKPKASELKEGDAARCGASRRHRQRHVALKPDTKTMIDAGFFNAMKDGAYFINTSRGETVDQQALVDAIPHERNSRRPRCLCHRTHFSRGRTLKIQLVMKRMSTARITSALQPIRHRKRLPPKRPHHQVFQRNRPGAERSESRTTNSGDASPGRSSSRSPRRAGPGARGSQSRTINVQEMENIVFEGAEAAVARINLDKAPSSATLESIARWKC
jgi:D-3-phosphoglycerate dehydrogenase